MGTAAENSLKEAGTKANEGSEKHQKAHAATMEFATKAHEEQGKVHGKDVEERTGKTDEKETQFAEKDKKREKSLKKQQDNSNEQQTKLTEAHTKTQGAMDEAEKSHKGSDAERI